MSLATLSDGVVTLDLGLWQGQFPLEDLPKWLAFYKRMRDRAGGKYAKHYVGTVAELERLQVAREEAA